MTDDKTLAVLDFVTGSLVVPGSDEDAYLIVCQREQLKPFLQQLQAAAPELDEAAKGLTGWRASDA